MAKTLVALYDTFTAGSCTSNLRLFRRPENRVEYPSFTTCGRGCCHGLRISFSTS